MELLTPSLLAETDLSPACEQPQSPAAPPEYIHQFPELEDTTRQARTRTAKGLGTHMDSVASTSLTTTASTIIASNSFSATTVHDFNLHILKHIMVCII